MNTAEETQILDAIGKWLERDVRPKARELEKKDEYPEAMVETMKVLGLFGATIPPVYGGLGLPASTYAKIVAQISEVWMSLTGIFNSHLIMAAAVARYGTEEQKRHYLPKFASGEIRGGLALTEPDCGTDLQAIRTRAVKDGDHYVINGTKRFITGAKTADYAQVIAVTDPVKGARGGVSCFMVSMKAPGVTLEKLWPTAKTRFPDADWPAWSRR